RRRRDPAGDDGDGAVRQPPPRLPLPVELERGRADDGGGEGPVGLERDERLDGLAEPLLVGEEGAAGLEQVADAGPLERLERAAEPGGERRVGRRGGRARGADRGG